MDNIISDHIDIKLLARIIESVPYMMFFKDTDGIYRVASKMFIDYNLRKVNVDIIGKTDIEILGEEIGGRNYKSDCDMLKNRTNVNYTAKTEDGRYYDVRKSLVLDNTGGIQGIVGVIFDVTEMYRIQEELRVLSRTDALTGLYNRNYYEECKHKMLKEDKLPFSVIMGDSNGLKRLNDKFGHHMGDMLLKETANILRKICKGISSKNLIFRIGGDEFVVFCPNTDHKQCEEMVKDIFVLENKSMVADLPISTSLGFATADSVDMDIDMLITEAEHRMYRQKAVKQELYINKINQI